MRKVTLTKTQVFSVAGLCCLLTGGLCFSATAAELIIDRETGALNEMIEEGPARVVVNYAPVEEWTAGVENLKLRVFYEGEPVANLGIQTGFPNSSAGVAVQDLDSDGVPEVRIWEFTGGQRCCSLTTVYGLVGDRFTEIDTSLVDGGLTGRRVEDLNGDGYSEVVRLDEAFFYSFASFAGSAAPPLILTFRDGEFVNTTREFPELIRADILQLEQTYLKNPDFRGNPNGFLAAYVANKAMLGEFEEAWAFMLENYDPQADLEFVLKIRDESGEVVGYHPDYPTALRAFLEDRDYL